jgi:hypothetical protein
MYAVDIEEIKTVDVAEKTRGCVKRFGQHSLTVQCLSYSPLTVKSQTSAFYARFIYVAYPGIFFFGRVQQIQSRIEGRENGDLGAVAP